MDNDTDGLHRKCQLESDEGDILKIRQSEGETFFMICFRKSAFYCLTIHHRREDFNNLLWYNVTHFDKASRRQQGKGKGLTMEG